MTKNILRIALLGEPKTGKTSLCQQLTDVKLRDEYVASVAVDFYRKEMAIKQKKLQLQLWDTAGCEEFAKISSSYAYVANIVMLCFDLQKGREALADLKKWLVLAEENINKENCKIIIVGLQWDAENAMTYDEAQADLNKDGLEKYAFYTTAVKDRDNVNKVFMNVVSDYLDLTAKKAVQARLAKYIMTVNRKYTKKNKFNYEFRFNSESRAINREINYYLAVEMSEAINNNVSLTEIFKDNRKIIAMRSAVIKKYNLDPDSKYRPTTFFNRTGINSDMLNETINEARKLLKK